MEADDYKDFDRQKDQIINCPPMYIGSIKRNPRIVDVLTINEEGYPKVVTLEITIPDGLERIFLEAVSNASDNVKRTRTKIIENKVRIIKNTIYEIRNIEVSVSEDGVISITNDGVPIPILLKNGVPIPQITFGKLNSSSNYTGTRSGIGVNGLGVKLCNIFSEYFTVEVNDPKNKLHYYQEWTDRMENVSDPEIQDSNDKKSMVKVTFKPLCSAFGYPDDYGCDDEMLSLFFKILADISFTVKVPIIFNSNEFNFSKPEEYLKLYFDDKDYLIYETTLNKEKNETIEIILIDDTTAKVVSFVNAMITRKGGGHVRCVYDSLRSYVSLVNDSCSKLLKDDPKKKLTLKDLESKLSFIVNYHIDDPEMTGQTKSEFNGIPTKFDIPDKSLKKMMNWKITRKLVDVIEAKFNRKIKKADGKQTEMIDSKKGIDAKYAGRKGDYECNLYIVEGDSAMPFPTILFDYIEGGKDLNGAFPLKGKPINPSDKSDKKILENKELKELIKFLGVKSGVDYTIDTNFETLRYKKVTILADADYDGTHISVLVLNIFKERFPTLLQREGYLWRAATDIAKAIKGKTEINFFSLVEYNRWKDETPNHKTYKIEYKKGLGTNSRKDILKYSKDPFFVELVYDELANHKMDVVIGKKGKLFEKKEWMKGYFPENTPELQRVQNVSEYIDYEFKGYCNYSLLRAIPKLDGLKTSQRKIVWIIMKNWGHSGKWLSSVLEGKSEKMKVEQFGNMVCQKTEYHHGEKNITKAIVRMAQDFTGTNNLPYFQQHGMFGTRTIKKASESRYIFVAPIWWLPLVFRNEDYFILDIQEEDGKKIEPSILLPIIPLILINGAIGTASGYSTGIPPHHVFDVCQWLIERLNGNQNPVLPNPWFRRFTGNVTVTSMKNEKLTMKTTGLYEVQENGDVLVTEIPVKTSIQDYRLFLDDLKRDGTIIDYDDMSDSETPRFLIQGMENPNHKKLSLEDNTGISNLVVLSNDNQPVVYKSREELLEGFYQFRLPYYQIRKDAMIDMLKKKSVFLDKKIQFIQAIRSERIIWRDRHKKNILEQMRELDLPDELLTSMNFGSFAVDSTEDLQKEIELMKLQLEYYVNTPPEKLWENDLSEFLEDYSDEKLDLMSGSEYEGYDGSNKKDRNNGTRRRKRAVVGKKKK